MDNASLTFCEGYSARPQSEQTCETLKEIAIEVFKTRQPKALPSLKKFLAALPYPKCIRNVLLVAIKETIEDDPDVGRWVLAHHALWRPELDLMAVAQQLALEQLQDRGWVLNQDFTFDQNGRLQANNAIIANLLTTAALQNQLLFEILV